MVGIVIVAHTPLANAMFSFAEHTFGVLSEGIRAVDIPPYEDIKASFDRVMKATYGVNADSGVLILTDVMGATPANVVSNLEVRGSLLGLNFPIVVLTGLNLPMLIRCISHRDTNLEGLASKALQGGKNGILRLGSQPHQEMTKK